MSNSSSKVYNKNKQEMLFQPKFPQKWILGSEFQKSKSKFESVLPRYSVCQLSR